MIYSKNINKKRTALSFIIILGVVSLLVDMVYEGARGITGPYFNLGCGAFWFAGSAIMG